MRSEPRHHKKRDALILGCGYLGRILAKKIIENPLYENVYGLVRKQTSGKQISQLGVRAIIGDILQPMTLYPINRLWGKASENPDRRVDIFYMIPPGRENAEEALHEGITNVCNVMSQFKSHIQQSILVSSTAVYGQSDGELIDADTEAKPNNQRAQWLLDAEQTWLASGNNFSVVRLAGIYGPRRIIGMSAIQAGSPLIGDRDAYLNLIHVEDAADLLIQIMKQDRLANRIELGCDGHPIQRKQYYATLARLIAAPEPEAISNETAAARFGLNLERLKRSSSKQLSNEITCQRTGWTPRYTDFVEGIRDSLLASRQ
ncbi:hypothetical protein KS4_13540 [Poriferisphaera corsica]|uniref:NAD-dependent epimerase/dehydratase domain-containing protein n=1 Tax=Poriferisphaera corsica TaxID=2528020 RepID=A0A517YSV8_9BACT|nr:NAD-dependent epimerase/dehydratase family protein [Poriferisphaera corsica]QDU33308.1 hypothetical protein KS4_13540 [Poriferisphaera corsica]